MEDSLETTLTKKRKPPMNAEKFLELYRTFLDKSTDPGTKFPEVFPRPGRLSVAAVKRMAQTEEGKRALDHVIGKGLVVYYAPYENTQHYDKKGLSFLYEPLGPETMDETDVGDLQKRKKRIPYKNGYRITFSADRRRLIPSGVEEESIKGRLVQSKSEERHFYILQNEHNGGRTPNKFCGTLYSYSWGLSAYRDYPEDCVLYRMWRDWEYGLLMFSMSPWIPRSELLGSYPMLERGGTKNLDGVLDEYFQPCTLKEFEWTTEEHLEELEKELKKLTAGFENEEFVVYGNGILLRDMRLIRMDERGWLRLDEQGAPDFSIPRLSKEVVRKSMEELAKGLKEGMESVVGPENVWVRFATIEGSKDNSIHFSPARAEKFKAPGIPKEALDFPLGIIVSVKIGDVELASDNSASLTGLPIMGIIGHMYLVHNFETYKWSCNLEMSRTVFEFEQLCCSSLIHPHVNAYFPLITGPLCTGSGDLTRFRSTFSLLRMDDGDLVGKGRIKGMQFVHAMRGFAGYESYSGGPYERTSSWKSSYERMKSLLSNSVPNAAPEKWYSNFDIEPSIEPPLSANIFNATTEAFAKRFFRGMVSAGIVSIYKCPYNGYYRIMVNDSMKLSRRVAVEIVRQLPSEPVARSGILGNSLKFKDPETGTYRRLRRITVETGFEAMMNTGTYRWNKMKRSKFNFKGTEIVLELKNEPVRKSEPPSDEAKRDIGGFIDLEVSNSILTRLKEAWELLLKRDQMFLGMDCHDEYLKTPVETDPERVKVVVGPSPGTSNVFIRFKEISTDPEGNEKEDFMPTAPIGPI